MNKMKKVNIAFGSGREIAEAISHHSADGEMSEKMNDIPKAEGVIRAPDYHPERDFNINPEVIMSTEQLRANRLNGDKTKLSPEQAARVMEVVHKALTTAVKRLAADWPMSAFDVPLYDDGPQVVVINYRDREDFQQQKQQYTEQHPGEWVEFIPGLKIKDKVQ